MGATPRLRQLVHIGQAPSLRAVREHLEAAAEARRCGDLAAADAAEIAALLALRASLGTPRHQAVRT